MAYDDAREVYAFLLEYALLFKPATSAGVRVSRDRHTRSAVRLRDRAQHTLNACGDARLVGRALEYRCAHARVRNAFLDVFDKHIDHDLRPAKLRARSL